MRVQCTSNHAWFYQWDLDQRLMLEECPSGIEVQYSSVSDGTDRTLVVDPYELDGCTYADVPNILLQHAGNINVYICDASGNTLYAKLIRVLPKEKPDDYVYTETEVKNYEALAARIDEIENNGVSVTHSWNGTTLTITSASGTSSADLKGERGEKGETGSPGANGSDYVMTAEDRTEIATEAAGMVDLTGYATETWVNTRIGDLGTADSIKTALGYTPADAEDVGKLEEAIANKLDAPATAQVGQIFKVTAVDDDGKITGVEAVDMPTGGDSEKIIVTVNLDEETSSHTSHEIMEYINSGREVVAITSDDPINKFVYNRTETDSLGEELYVYFISQPKEERNYAYYKLDRLCVDHNGEGYRGRDFEYADYYYVEGTKNSTVDCAYYSHSGIKYQTDNEIAVVDAETWEYSVDWQRPKCVVLQMNDNMSLGGDILSGMKFTLHPHVNGSVCPYVTYYVEDKVVQIFKSLEDLNAHYGL